METYRPLGGTSRRYLVVATGEEISRREFLKRTRGVSFEQIVAQNKATNLEATLARPARGRKSVTKLAPEEQSVIIEARKEAEQRKREIAAQKKAEKAVEKKVQALAKKSVRQKKVTKQLLKTGRLGARIAIGSYDGYLQALKEARAIGVVIAYSIGVVMANSETGDERDATIFSLRDVSDEIDMPEFMRETREFLESRTYKATFVHWFMHLAYSKKYAQERVRKRKGK